MAFFWVVVAAAIMVTTPYLAGLQAHTRGWLTFSLLAGGAAIAQLFVAVTPGNQTYNVTGVFLVAAALLLPPELVALAAFVQHIPDWLKRRLPFQIQAFNIANYTLATMAAWGTAHAILASDFPAGYGASTFVAAALACVVFVALNHCLLAPMLWLARSLSVRESGLFSYANLSTDLVLAGTGIGLATLWQVDAWLIPFAIVPLVLVHRSLSVPALQAEARVDPKTGLFNARHFATAIKDELERATRFARPMAVVMADLDLLREINNTYGHLAGDAVLAGVARIFRDELREYDIPARFGGEEFSILLPETSPEEAFEIASRIRHAVAASGFEVETSAEPIRATVSFGIASFPRDGADANDLIHQADLAVYRAKLQGRNRVVDASSELLPALHDLETPQLASRPDGSAKRVHNLRSVPQAVLEAERRIASKPHGTAWPYLVWIPRRLAVLVGLVGGIGAAVGVIPLVLHPHVSYFALVAIIALVGVGQVVSLELDQTGAISVSAVGALAGAAIIGAPVALVLAITMAAVEWSARRTVFHQLFFNVGAFTLASLAAAEVFSLHAGGTTSKGAVIASGVVAGLTYFAVSTALLSLAVSAETHQRARRVWRERFGWLVAHYAVYGLIAGVIYEAYTPIGVWALIVFVLPLLLMRTTQEAYLRRTERSARKLLVAADTIQSQNVSLEQANRRLKERSTAAMESLSTAVDARDTYTAGHSRRVQQVALAIGRELGLSQSELGVIGYAALFHDIGKLAIPDSILLKPASLTREEWALMMRHSGEGASIISRLGFLNDSVPAIRHHHERFDGSGYPDRLIAEEIPLGARIIHVADAFDSMRSTRVYGPARRLDEALGELREGVGSQFCPRCVRALEGAVRAGNADLCLPPEAVAVAS